jgi:hypothetical protein
MVSVWLRPRRGHGEQAARNRARGGRLAGMDRRRTQALSDVLDRLEETAQGESIAVGDVVERLGHRSFAALMLTFALVSTSPASAIPGLTTAVAALVFLLAVQMIAGRDCVWLPGVVTKRRMETATLRKGIGWLRGPVRFAERFLRPRLGFVYRRPIIYVPLILILGLTLLMPVMEAVPTSGSVASAVIAVFAAGLLTRDGALAILAALLLLALPVAVWQFGLSG